LVGMFVSCIAPHKLAAHMDIMLDVIDTHAIAQDFEKQKN